MPQERVTANVVLKREDGRSVLDAAGPITSETVGEFSVGAARIAETRRQLEALGFEVAGEGQTTLSITATPERFHEVFALDVAAGTKAPAHAARIPGDLADMMADVFVPPTPQFFP